MVNARTFEEAYSLPFPEVTPEQDTVGQEVRYALGLSADTTASCEVRYGRLEGLHDGLPVHDAADAS